MKKNRGFTIIEYMVAMAMSLFCVLAVSGIYIAVKRNFLDQGGISSFQENQRLAMTMLTNSIQSAGYFVDPLTSTQQSVFIENTDWGLTTGQFITGSQSDTAGSSITIRYESASGDGVMNCLGASNKSGANIVFINTFSVNTDNKLICKANDSAGDISTVVLASNIKKLNILYAQDTNADGKTDRYVTANAVTDWKQVKAVRLTMTFIDTINSTASNVIELPSVNQYVNIMSTYEYL
ncbi:MAG: PilW family protein [Comamonas sp.]|uniref:PilW family protein n=1 Tax=Comamonas sp. TaxID=34028 RepID=UPI003D119608